MFYVSFYDLVLFVPTISQTTLSQTYTNYNLQINYYLFYKIMYKLKVLWKINDF